MTNDNATPEHRLAQGFGVIVSQFPCHSLAKTFVVEGWNGQRVVVKASGHPIGRTKVIAETRHLIWLASRREQFPHPIAFGEADEGAFVVLPFFTEATLSTQLHSSQTPARESGAICASLFHQLYEPRREYCCANSNLLEEIFRLAYVERVFDRLKRVELAFHALGVIPADQPRLIINGKEYLRPLDLMRSRLGSSEGMRDVDACHDLTAWHGDLTPLNILYGNEKGTERFVFIDPRGDVIWRNGQPKWDPAYDAGKLCFYFESWEPVTGGAISIISDQSFKSKRVAFEFNGCPNAKFNENFFSQLGCFHPNWMRSAFQLRGRFAAACHCLADSWSRMTVGSQAESLAEYLLGVQQLDAVFSDEGME